MKKLFFSLVIFTAVCCSANAQQPVQNEKKSDAGTNVSDEKTEVKKTKPHADFRNIQLYRKDNAKNNPKLRLAKRIDMRNDKPLKTKKVSK